MSLADLTISDAAAGLRRRSFTSAMLTAAHLKRIATRDPHYHAFAELDEHAAMARAAQADAELAAGRDEGPLHGIPVAIKDLIDTQDAITAYGSPAFSGHQPSADAAVVQRLKRSGAVILGKLATYEFALVGPAFDTPYPPTVNPWNSTHITGGSSSGCAAAVAGGLVRTSIGTDTGGSIRSPAGYCGVVGLKPTYGTLPLVGIFPLAPSLDHCGPISATVAEAAITLDGLAGRAVGDPRSASRRLAEGAAGLKIAYARSWFADDSNTHSAIVTAIDVAVTRLAQLGALVEEVELPPYQLFEDCGAVIIHAEALASHDRWLREKAEKYGRLALQSIAAGLPLEAPHLAAAIEVAVRLRREFDTTIFGKYDALITANTLTPAPPFSAFDDSKPVWTPMRTLPFNVTGHPALVLPIGFSDGLPIGLQIVGPLHQESIICQLGAALDQLQTLAPWPPPA